MSTMTERRAAWWPSRQTPPPASWAYVIEDLLAPDRSREWARAAALFIEVHTTQRGHGPTFNELFIHLLPETNGVPSRRPEGVKSRDHYHARSYFRLYVMREWRKHDLFVWRTGVHRSLNVPGKFAKRLRQLERADTERS